MLGTVPGQTIYFRDVLVTVKAPRMQQKRVYCSPIKSAVINVLVFVATECIIT